jgi:hypothetical protein
MTSSSSSSNRVPAASGGQGHPAHDPRSLSRVLTLLAVVTCALALAAYFLGRFNATPPGAQGAAPHQR